MGTNILYLALGFLEWYESRDSDVENLAPLFLVPVQLKKGKLNRRTGAYQYKISFTGEDIVPNLSLREKLRIEFGIALPELDENSTPESYFEIVQRLIDENQPRWKLKRFITLTLLNFSKLLMYLDLDPDRWPENSKICDHSLVKRLLGGSQDSSEGGGSLSFEEDYEIDKISNIHQTYPIIFDADSSQHSALVDVIDGRSIVIEGPPGTGKSQTIANVIAAAISQNKTVLFIAEKLAALEVVKRRLDSVGLGDFCLELLETLLQSTLISGRMKVTERICSNMRPA
jgi:hypothetical protein